MRWFMKFQIVGLFLAVVIELANSNIESVAGIGQAPYSRKYLLGRGRIGPSSLPIVCPQWRVCLPRRLRLVGESVARCPGAPVESLVVGGGRPCSEW